MAQPLASPNEEKTAAEIAFGRYRLLEKLAEGPLGEVFLAEDAARPAGSTPRVIVERIRAAFSADPAFVRTFLDEASTAARLSHPNLVRVTDFGKVEDNYFVAMEHVAGHSVRAVLERTSQRGVGVPARLAAWIAARVCAALEHVHQTRRQCGRASVSFPGHVTPPSIRISDGGEVKLVAFGIDGVVVDDGAAAGTVPPGDLPYLAPEAARSERGDERGDVFSVARMLFELITGPRGARSADDVAAARQWEVSRAQAEGRPVRALSTRSIQQWEVDRALNALPDLPSALRNVLHRGLQSDPQRRFASAEEMRSELERFLAGQPEPVGEAEVASFLRRLFKDTPAGGGPGAGGRRERKVPDWIAERFPRRSLAVIGALVAAVELFVIAAPQVRAARFARTEAQRAVDDLANGLPSVAVSRFDLAFRDAPSWLVSTLRARHAGAYVDALERDGARRLEEGDLDAARKRFEIAVQLDPGRFGPHLSLGRLEARSADPRAAERELLAALAIDPASEVAREALASVDFDQGRYAEALEHYQHLVKSQSGKLDEVWLRIAACHRYLARAAAADGEAALQRGLAAFRRRQQDLAATLALFDVTPAPAETRAAPAAPVASPTVAPVAPVAAPPAPAGDLVHRVECPGECLRDIAAWHTGSGENWRKLVSPVNRGVSSECVPLKIGREVRIPAALVTRAEAMPCDAAGAPTGPR